MVELELLLTVRWRPLCWLVLEMLFDSHQIAYRAFSEGYHIVLFALDRLGLRYRLVYEVLGRLTNN